MRASKRWAKLVDARLNRTRACIELTVWVQALISFPRYKRIHGCGEDIILLTLQENFGQGVYLSVQQFSTA